MSDELMTADQLGYERPEDSVVDLLRSKGLEHFQPVSEREAELEGLLKEPLLDMLMRKQGEEKDISFFGATPVDCSPDCFCQKEAAPARLIAERVYGRHQVHRQQTETIILFDDEELQRLDRREFRQRVSERLNAAGDALMAAWDQLHGEQSE